MGLIFPHYATIADLFRLSNRGAKGMKMAQKAPTILEEYRRKTHFEIELYYGDYISAVQHADAHSPLPPLLELLEAQAKGERFEDEIELEQIPKLNPQAVKQIDALRLLEEKLSESTVVGLEGIPGSSKTYLAVQLANKYKNDSNRAVFWYNFHEGKDPI